MLMKNQTFIRTIILLLITISLAACQLPSGMNEEKKGNHDEQLPLTFYYDGVCASCETEEAFRQTMQEALKGLKREAFDYRAINTMKYDKNWREELAADFPEYESFQLPIVRIGDRLLMGDNEIANGLREAAHLALGIDYTEYIYYQRPDCPDCQEIEASYQEWREQPGVIVREKNVKEEANLEELRSLFDKHGIEGDDRQIPFFITVDESEYWIIFRVDELLKAK